MDHTKGQKIIAALYLVTKHLSDNDPIKLALREYSIALVESDAEERAMVAQSIDTVLGGAVLAGLISEQNASIIILELRRYASPAFLGADTLAGLFSIAPSVSHSVPSPTIKRTMTPPPPARPLPPQKSQSQNQTIGHTRTSFDIQDTKGKRQDQILSFINERKSAGIKDIVALFSDISEKTIQRELSALVAAGRIIKRGEKRWSVYLAI